MSDDRGSGAAEDAEGEGCADASYVFDMGEFEKMERRGLPHREMYIALSHVHAEIDNLSDGVDGVRLDVTSLRS